MKISKKLIGSLCTAFISTYSMAQDNKDSFEIYGYVNTDAGYNFNSIDPNWFDVMRPTKLPSYPNQFGPDGSVYYSVRQSKLGFKSNTETSIGELKTQFDFDLVGFGKGVGQTTFHVVNFYGQVGHFGAGQTPTPFMDLEACPTTLDYWGPLSRAFFLNIQFRYIVFEKKNERLLFALERPGATSDGSNYTEAIDLQHVKPVFDAPNLTAQYRKGGKWGYVQLGAVAKSIRWKDISDTSAYNLSGSTFAWGGSLSTVIRTSNWLTIKCQGIFGNGIENYIADAGVDIAREKNPGNPAKPYIGKALPVWGFFSFVEINWNELFRSSIGYSMLTIQNTSLQSSSAFREGQYGLANLRYYLVKNVMMGIEYQYGRRNDLDNGFHANGNKLQLSFRYSFSKQFIKE
ncbi:MAG TPA: DcaP family trimeric outer membrane transporter [Mucilaginibacter sp.]|jgi:hypothetical protein